MEAELSFCSGVCVKSGSDERWRGSDGKMRRRGRKTGKQGGKYGNERGAI